MTVVKPRYAPAKTAGAGRVSSPALIEGKVYMAGCIGESPEPPDKPLLLECLYDPVQAGRYLGMSERMMHRRLDSGAIGHVKVGRKRLIRGAQILAFMNEHEMDALPANMRPRLADV